MKTAEETREEFRQELQALLDKYEAIVVVENYNEEVLLPDHSIAVSIPGILREDGMIVREQTELLLGSYLEGKSRK